MTFQKTITFKNIFIGTILTLILAMATLLVFKVYLAHANTPFVVDSNLDTGDAAPGDGACDDGAGHCTLRAALEESNALAGADVINFSGPMTITPATILPAISTPVSIVGATGTDCNWDTRSVGVVIDGSLLTGPASVVDFISGADGSSVSGITINNVSDITMSPIHVFSIDGFSMTCMNIGTNPTGSAIVSNIGVSFFTEVSNLTIGGISPGEGNLVSGNESGGLHIDDSTGVEFYGNRIGTDATGLIALGNALSDIITASPLTFSGCDDVTVGVPGDDGRNIIAGNDFGGVLVDHSSNMVLRNNYVGLGADGITYLPNNSHSVNFGTYYGDTSNIQFGGSIAAGESNYIVGETGLTLGMGGGNAPGTTMTNIAVYGNYFNIDTAGNPTPVDVSFVFLSSINGLNYGDGTADHRNYLAGAPLIMQTTAFGNPPTHVAIKGNYFGVDTAGNPTAGYGSLNYPGISLAGAMSDNIIIGGTTAGEANIIAGNGGGGVAMSSSVTDILENVSILGNSIYGNDRGTASGMGIDTQVDNNGDGNPESNTGPNLNDYHDTDTGPNDLLNHPVIIKTEDDPGIPGNTIVTYMLDVPAGDYRMEFFTNPTFGAGLFGFGEGEIFIDSDNVTSSGDPEIFQTSITADLADTISATITEIDGSNITGFGSTSEFSNAVLVDRGTSSGTETTFTTNGAYSVLNGVGMGACANADTVTNDDAMGPSQTGAFTGTAPCTNDKDGVTLASSYSTGSTISFPVIITNPDAVGDDILNAWIDSNSDGDFDDSGEHVIDNLAVVPGSNTVSFTAPSTAGTYNVRFRNRAFSSFGASLAIGGDTTTGEALVGEVEDYALTITGATTGGGTSSGTQFACKDPFATNYYAGSAVLSHPSVCMEPLLHPLSQPTQHQMCVLSLLNTTEKVTQEEKYLKYNHS